MPIKPGDILAGVPGQTPTMVSDGKRMRVLWSKAHGDGDSNNYLIERSANTLAGHPTWKLYCGDISGPIVREKNEPPKYIYLDDRACYEIWKSKQYNRAEMKTFWPFDFDYIGNIKTARTNKGRPAYEDESCTRYATGTLRQKTKEYVFSGSPDYVPISSINEEAGPIRIKTEPGENSSTVEGSAISADVTSPNAATANARSSNATTSKATTSKAITSKAITSIAITSKAITSKATMSNATSYTTTSSRPSYERDNPHDSFSPMSWFSSDFDDESESDTMFWGVAPKASRTAPHPWRTAGAYKHKSEVKREEVAATQVAEKRKRSTVIEGMPFGKRVKW